MKLTESHTPNPCWILKPQKFACRSHITFKKSYILHVGLTFAIKKSQESRVEHYGEIHCLKRVNSFNIKKIYETFSPQMPCKNRYVKYFIQDIGSLGLNSNFFSNIVT